MTLNGRNVTFPLLWNLRCPNSLIAQLSPPLPITAVSVLEPWSLGDDDSGDEAVADCVTSVARTSFGGLLVPARGDVLRGGVFGGLHFSRLTFGELRTLCLCFLSLPLLTCSVGGSTGKFELFTELTLVNSA